MSAVTHNFIRHTYSAVGTCTLVRAPQMYAYSSATECVCVFVRVTVCIREVVSMSNIDFRPRTANVCTKLHFNYICLKHISVGSSWVSEFRRLYRTTQNRIITIQLPFTTVASRNFRHRFHVYILPTRWQALCHGFEWIFSLFFFFLFFMLKIRHYRVLVIVEENDVDLSVRLCRAIILSRITHIRAVTYGVCASGRNGAVSASMNSHMTWCITFVLSINSASWINSSECCSRITQMHYEYFDDSLFSHSLCSVSHTSLKSYPYIF